MAFEIAYDNLHIEQLLDPEDVNVHKPDKKSILMYVLCMYNSIDCKKLEDEEEENLKQQKAENVATVQPNVVASTVSESNNDKDTATPIIASPAAHPGNVTHLDDISLAKSIEDLRNFHKEEQPSTTLSADTNLVQKLEHADVSHSNLKLAENLVGGEKPETQFYWESNSR